MGSKALQRQIKHELQKFGLLASMSLSLKLNLKRVSVESGNLARLQLNCLLRPMTLHLLVSAMLLIMLQSFEASLKGAVGGMSDIGTVSDATTSV